MCPKSGNWSLRSPFFLVSQLIYPIDQKSIFGILHFRKSCRICSKSPNKISLVIHGSRCIKNFADPFYLQPSITFQLCAMRLLVCFHESSANSKTYFYGPLLPPVISYPASAALPVIPTSQYASCLFRSVAFNCSKLWMKSWTLRVTSFYKETMWRLSNASWEIVSCTSCSIC